MCIYPWASVIRLKDHPYHNNNSSAISQNKDVSVRAHPVNGSSQHCPVVILADAAENISED